MKTRPDTAVLSDRSWKEDNAEFGEQTICDHDVGRGEKASSRHDNTAHTYQELEIDHLPKITLRGKSQISQSTGLALWISSQILSGYLSENPQLVRGKRVLELGAGLGLCGIVAHHLGAKHVIATDGDTEVLSHLRYNINQNQKTPTELSSPQLVWGEDLDEFRNVHGRQPVILATDVFYAPESIKPLWQTVDHMLERDGCFLLAFCPHRVPLEQVLEHASHLGYAWKISNPAETNDDEEDEVDLFASTSSFAYYIVQFRRKVE